MMDAALFDEANAGLVGVGVGVFAEFVREAASGDACADNDDVRTFVIFAIWRG